MKRIKVVFIIWIIVSGSIYLLNGSKAAAAMAIIAAAYSLFAFISVRVAGRDLKAVMSGSRSVDKGEPANVVVKTENPSRLPVPACTFELDCENILTKENRKVPLSYTFGPKGKNSGGLMLKSTRCGEEHIKISSATISDPAGLFKKKREVSGETSVFVMPEIKEVEIPSDYLDSYDMESYTYSQVKQGQDTGEVFGIRDYREGDSPKQIHWKLTAKMDDVMVKIPSFPIENKLIVILDNCISEKDDLSSDKRNDLMELFFSLSYSLIKKNVPHSLGWFDHRSKVFIKQKVENEQEMWNAVPGALGAGIEYSGMSTAYSFLASSTEEHFTNHFIVTSTDPAELERLEEYGAVRVFRS